MSTSSSIVGIMVFSALILSVSCQQEASAILATPPLPPKTRFVVVDELTSHGFYYMWVVRDTVTGNEYLVNYQGGIQSLGTRK